MNSNGEIEHKEKKVSGFKMRYIKIQDVSTRAVLWCETEDFFSNEKFWEIKLPRNIFNRKKIRIEINFTSTEPWDHLIMKHQITSGGLLKDEFDYEFGIVPGNTMHTWTQVISEFPDADLMTPDILSGNVVFKTEFYDGETLITTSNIGVFYED